MMAKRIRIPDPRIVRAHMWPQRNHVREQLASRMCLPLLIFVVRKGIRTARPTHCGVVQKWAQRDRAQESCAAYVLDFTIFLVPQRGFEPLTHALRMRCSTN
jgi:hypothetical protein